MNVIFKNERNEQLDIQIDVNDVIYDVKERIKKQYFNNNPDNWLIFSFENDKPIREFGKQDLIPGMIPLTFDRKRFSDFSIRDGIIYNFTVFEFFQKKETKKQITTNNTLNYQKEKIGYNLSNENDFPSLSI